MFRLSGLFSVALAVLCAGALFWTSQSVQRAEFQLSNAAQSNEAEKETLRVLSAEWDYLNRPERLEALTLNNLDMDEAHAKGDNFLDISEDIPEPVVPVLPKIKPDFLQHVSTPSATTKVKPKAPSAVINNYERESFDSLIESFAEEGTP